MAHREFSFEPSLPIEIMTHPDSALNISENGVVHLDAVIDHIAHWLPAQGPIKDFIHHNTLHAVQNRPFHEGVAVAAKVLGAKSYLPLADYQQRYREGRITDKALDWAIAQADCSAEDERALRASLFESDQGSHYPPPSLANHGIRNAWLTHLGLDLNALVHPVLFRLLSNFLDQGISRWALPKPEENFWDCVVRLVKTACCRSILFIRRWSGKCWMPARNR
jgi:hypothetical protein